MKVYDINQSLKPPKGYRLTSLEPAGAYLKLTYHDNGNPRASIIEIYLNDQGREVVRVSNESDSEQSNRVLVPAPDFEKTFGLSEQGKVAEVQLTAPLWKKLWKQEKQFWGDLKAIFGGK